MNDEKKSVLKLDLTRRLVSVLSADREDCLDDNPAWFYILWQMIQHRQNDPREMPRRYSAHDLVELSNGYISLKEIEQNQPFRRVLNSKLLHKILKAHRSRIGLTWSLLPDFDIEFDNHGATYRTSLDLSWRSIYMIVEEKFKSGEIDEALQLADNIDEQSKSDYMLRVRLLILKARMFSQTAENKKVDEVFSYLDEIFDSMKHYKSIHPIKKRLETDVRTEYLATRARYMFHRDKYKKCMDDFIDLVSVLIEDYHLKITLGAHARSYALYQLAATITMFGEPYRRFGNYRREAKGNHGDISEDFLARLKLLPILDLYEFLEAQKNPLKLPLPKRCIFYYDLSDIIMKEAVESAEYAKSFDNFMLAKSYSVNNLLFQMVVFARYSNNEPQTETKENIEKCINMYSELITLRIIKNSAVFGMMNSELGIIDAHILLYEMDKSEVRHAQKAIDFINSTRIVANRKQYKYQRQILDMRWEELKNLLNKNGIYYIDQNDRIELI